MGGVAKLHNKGGNKLEEFVTTHTVADCSYYHYCIEKERLTKKVEIKDPQM